MYRWAPIWWQAITVSSIIRMLKWTEPGLELLKALSSCETKRQLASLALSAETGFGTLYPILHEARS